MDTQIIIALCEGPHDVAFLNKIIKTRGFLSNEKCKLDDYPRPMSDLLIKEASRTDVEGMNIQEVRQSLLPANALTKDNVHILLYIMGGDSRAEKRIEFISKIQSTIVLPGEIKQGRENHNVTFGIAYFFDADSKGIQNRLETVKTELRKVVPSIPEDHFTANGAFGTYEKIKLGCFIFSGDDNNTGKLEDILLPIMSESNDEIFSAANKFLDDFHNGDRLFPLKLKPVEGQVKEERSDKAKDKYRYDKGKSLIGAVGQLQQSGASNVVCIGHTDYLTLAKIKGSKKCEALLTFLDGFIGHL